MVELVHGSEKEPQNYVSIAAPASELFDSSTLWPPEVEYNSSFIAEVLLYNERVLTVNETFDLLPDSSVSFQEAFDAGILNAAQIESVYVQLSHLLSDPDYSRLALYLPFEVLPDQKWQPSDTKFAGSLNSFRSAYVRAWYSLLDTEDVRANFVDGDVLEVELRENDLTRVVKATHLIPELLSRGLVDRDDIMDIYNGVDNPLLRRGITEGLEAYDLQAAPDSKKPSSADVLDELEFLVAGGSIVTTEPTTKRRTQWLTQTKIQSLIDIYSESTYHDIVNEMKSIVDIPSIATIENRTLAVTVFISGLQKAIERSDNIRTQSIYTAYEPDLLRLYETSDIKTRDLLTQTFRLSYHLGVCSKQTLDNLGIVLPKLSGSLSENLQYMPDELSKITGALETIRTDPLLSHLLYPVVSVGGSRLKGYGEQTSDIDVGIFVRPNVLREQKDEMRTVLRSLFEDTPFEVWLDSDDKKLTVRELTDDDGVTADRYWTHILFGTAWVGDEPVINEIRKQLLPTYFQTNPFPDNSRRLYLEQLEQDALQYRLLHKGYIRHFPRINYKKFQDKTSIDGSSIFWDSGYRQLATRLFVEKVFLPKL